jgi:hypothetical protein
MSRSTPATLDRALTVHLSGDRIEVELGTYTTPLFNRLLAGSGVSGKTTVAAVDLGGAGRPLLQVADGSSPVWWPTQDYLCIENLELKHGDAATKSTAGEAIVTTDSSTHARFVDILGCKIGNTRNIAIQSKYGPTPSDGTSTGTPGLDDASWRILGTEIYRANRHLIVAHGTGWEIGPWTDGLGVLRRSQLHWWGDSTVAGDSGKHALYGHSRNAVLHGFDAWNSEADTPWTGGISQRASGLEVFDYSVRDMSGFSFFWYDNQLGVTRIHDGRGWNLYNYAIIFSAVSDPGFSPPYVWGPNAVDRFVFAKNSMHIKGQMTGSPLALAAADACINFNDASAAYVGGVEVADNVLTGNWTYALKQAALLANHGVTGTLHEHHNRWFRDGNGALQFKYGSTTYNSLSQWQAA